jgi:hypothetical protein
LKASGASYGLRAILLYLFGIALGVGMIFFVVTAAGSALVMNPLMRTIPKWVGPDTCVARLLARRRRAATIKEKQPGGRQQYGAKNTLLQFGKPRIAREPPANTGRTGGEADIDDKAKCLRH